MVFTMCMCSNAIRYKCFVWFAVLHKKNFDPTIQYYVNAEQSMYQFPLVMFRISDQRPLLWTSAKRCPILQQHFPCVFFLPEVRYQDIVATAKKGSKSAERHAVFRQILIHFQNIEHMVIAKVKVPQVCDTLCWRNLRNTLHLEEFCIASLWFKVRSDFFFMFKNGVSLMVKLFLFI